MLMAPFAGFEVALALAPVVFEPATEASVLLVVVAAALPEEAAEVGPPMGAVD